MIALKRSDIGVQLVHIGKRMFGSPIMATTTTCEIKKYVVLTPLLFFVFYKFRRVPIRTWMIWFVISLAGLSWTSPGDSTAPLVYLGVVVSVLSLAAHFIIIDRSRSNGYRNTGEWILLLLVILTVGVGSNVLEIINGTFDMRSFEVAAIGVAFIVFVFSIGYGFLYLWMSFKKHPVVEDYIKKVCRTVEIVD